MASGSGSGSAAYAERLWPSPAVWFLVVAFGAALGLVPAPVSARAGLVTAVVAVAGLVLLVVLTTPRISVCDAQFVAGRARIPVDVLDRVDALDARAMRIARGPGLDARAYLCLRGWLPDGVRVALADPDDPTPYWLVSTRHPQVLAGALTASLRPAGRDGTPGTDGGPGPDGTPGPGGTSDRDGTSSGRD